MKLKTAELGQKVGLSRMQIWRLALGGHIPGKRKSKGGHFYFVDCKALRTWIWEREVRTLLNASKEREKRGVAEFREAYKPAEKSVRSAAFRARRSAYELERFLVSRPRGWWTDDNRAFWEKELRPIVKKIQALRESELKAEAR